MLLTAEILDRLAAFGRCNPGFDFTGVTLMGSGNSWYAECRDITVDDGDCTIHANIRVWGPDPLAALQLLAWEIEEVKEQHEQEKVNTAENE